MEQIETVLGSTASTFTTPITPSTRPSTSCFTFWKKQSGLAGTGPTGNCSPRQKSSRVSRPVEVAAAGRARGPLPPPVSRPSLHSGGPTTTFSDRENTFFGHDFFQHSQTDIFCQNETKRAKLYNTKKITLLLLGDQI